MGIFDWLRKKKKKLSPANMPTPGRQGSDESIHMKGIGYKPQTASTEKPLIFSTQAAADAYARKTCRFTSYMIEGISLVGLDKKHDGTTYEVYAAQSRGTVLKFLRAIPYSEIPRLYYVIVETPSGNFGKDVNGMFDESTGRSIE